MKITAVDAQQLIPVGADRIEWYNLIWDFLWCYIIKMSNQSSPNSTEIQAIFDQIAPEYDRLNQELSLGLHRVWKLMTVKWCQPEKGDFALDICCGSGDLT
ncbi:MAG: class I SAM-dependent methyltransferase, partial [Microcystis aeruginosa]